MQDLSNTLSQVERPRLLIAAARRGLALYDRNRDLGPILRTPRAPDRPADHLLRLEQQLEHDRRAGTGVYSASRHIAVLTALMSEAGARAA